MRVHSYVIDHDLGFAPNPFHRVCTLSACKPLIRRHASLGDYVAGTGSIPNGLKDRLVYWMRVDAVGDRHAARGAAGLPQTAATGCGAEPGGGGPPAMRDRCRSSPGKPRPGRLLSKSWKDLYVL